MFNIVHRAPLHGKHTSIMVLLLIKTITTGIRLLQPVRLYGGVLNDISRMSQFTVLIIIMMSPFGSFKHPIFSICESPLREKVILLLSHHHSTKLMYIHMKTEDGVAVFISKLLILLYHIIFLCFEFNKHFTFYSLFLLQVYNWASFFHGE